MMTMVLAGIVTECPLITMMPPPFGWPPVSVALSMMPTMSNCDVAFTGFGSCARTPTVATASTASTSSTARDDERVRAMRDVVSGCMADPRLYERHRGTNTGNDTSAGASEVVDDPRCGERNFREAARGIRRCQCVAVETKV